MFALFSHLRLKSFRARSMFYSNQSCNNITKWRTHQLHYMLRKHGFFFFFFCKMYLMSRSNSVYIFVLKGTILAVIIKAFT